MLEYCMKGRPFRQTNALKHENGAESVESKTPQAVCEKSNSRAPQEAPMDQMHVCGVVENWRRDEDALCRMYISHCM